MIDSRRSRRDGTLRRAWGVLAVPSRHDGAGAASDLGQCTASPRLAGPTEQVVLEVPAQRAQRLVRLQVAAIIVVSIAAGLLAILCIALPADDRALALLALGVAVTLSDLDRADRDETTVEEGAWRVH